MTITTARADSKGPRIPRAEDTDSTAQNPAIPYMEIVATETVSLVRRRNRSCWA
jgi:hypothetical protein